jgi:exopolysaccharide production protein ExoQ
MSHCDYTNTRPTLQVRRCPWFLFLIITTIFLLSYHDLSHAKNSIGDYNESQDELLAYVVDGSPVHRILLLSLGLIATVSLARHRGNSPLRIGGLLGWLVLAFAGWALISPIWADDFTLTIRRVVAFEILWVSAIAIVRRASLREIILWIWLSTTIFLLIGIAAEIVFGTFHPFASGYRFAGTMHPNYQGMQCGLLTLSAVAAANMETRRRVLFWACGCLGFVFLILTGSRTSLAAALLALVVYSAMVSSRTTKIATVFGCSLIVSFLALSLGTGLLPRLKTAILLGRDDPGNVDSLSGRMMIWEDVGYYIRQRPFLGYGYGGFWTPTRISVISDEEKQAIPNSHSTYMEYLVSLGPAGLVAYVLLLFAGIRRAYRFHRLSRNSAFAFCGALLVFCALIGFLEVVITEGSPLMFPCILILAYLAFTLSEESARRPLRIRLPLSREARYGVVETGR